MLSSSSVINRFTPPTCTLEIWAKNAPLSGWTKQQKVEEISFQLHFDDPRLPPEKQVTVGGDRAKLEQLHQVVNKYVRDFLRLSPPYQLKSLSPRANESTTTVTEVEPRLQPQGLVAHELWLGSLAEGVSGCKIDLSAVQLFDLATALNEYYKGTLASAKLNSAKPKKIVTLWGSALGATVLAVGLAIVGIKVFNQSRTNTNPTASQSEVADPSTSERVIPDVVPPQVSRTSDRSVAQPRLTNPLSSADKLPPPPPVDLPKPPPPNVPDPAKYPFPEPPTLVAPKPSQSTIAIKPNSSDSSRENTASPAREMNSRARGTQPTNNLAPTEPKTQSSSSSNSIQIETNKTRDGISSSELPPPVAPENKLSQTDASTTDKTSQSPATEVARLDGINPSTAQNSQVQEVKEYFQKQWQPPEDLKQTLEYRLVLNGNGSIQRIIPLGKASEIYLDRTGIPLMGESFVSPTRESKNLTVRLLLSPDGEVKTFLE
jgi:hypothetical protein